MRPYLFALLAGVVLAAGCKNPCRQLAESLCDCEPNTPLKEQCLRTVQQREGQLDEPITEAQRSLCLAKLETCDCRKLEDPSSAERAKAKRECALARETPETP